MAPEKPKTAAKLPSLSTLPKALQQRRGMYQYQGLASDVAEWWRLTLKELPRR